ncbi:Uncharacterised protein [Moraxella lacunata]|uniref:Uncharacterized protein n=3 Tax=Moraxella lacunata TaxID=477 RepID=A0A378QK74_MORLA|nr:Uncharacterised protein [Moraxella lacunata]
MERGLIAVGRFWLIITVTMAGTVFFQKRQKENTLKEIKNLPKITPFIAITHQDVRVYNRFGKELVVIPTDNIATMYAFDLSGGSKLHIHYKRAFWRFFVYTIGSNEMGATFYFEHQNEKYIPESLKSCVWIISNMVKMLQQDPIASHFPFVKKNYTNGRA